MRIIRYAACFLAGIVFSAVLLVSTDNLPKAWAYSNCIKKPLTAKLTNGDINENDTFTIVYEVPSCYAQNGYSIKSTFAYESNMPAVVYTKK